MDPATDTTALTAPARDIDLATGKPIMTSKEASFHCVCAGIEAREKAAAAGGNQAAIDALVSGGLTLKGGIELKPFSMLTGIAMGKLSSPYMQDTDGGDTNFMDIALAALCFMDPRGVHSLIVQKKRELLEEDALKFAEAVDVATMQQINDFIQKEMGREVEPAEESAPGKPKGKAAAKPKSPPEKPVPVAGSSPA